MTPFRPFRTFKDNAIGKPQQLKLVGGASQPFLFRGM